MWYATWKDKSPKICSSKFYYDILHQPSPWLNQMFQQPHMFVIPCCNEQQHSGERWEVGCWNGKQLECEGESIHLPRSKVLLEKWRKDWGWSYSVRWWSELLLTSWDLHIVGDGNQKNHAFHWERVSFCKNMLECWSQGLCTICDVVFGVFCVHMYHHRGHYPNQAIEHIMCDL